MNYLLIIYFLLISFLSYSEESGHEYHDRNFLNNEFKAKAKSLTDLTNWRNNLRTEFRNNLQNLPEQVRKNIIEKADNVSKTEWETIPVINYLAFIISGERDYYEFHDFNRRIRLRDLILAELLVDSGKYVNQIANGIWIILEESTWIWPAHLGLQKAGVGLPDPTQQVIDLGAGETAATVAWTKFLMGEKLTKLSPIITKRIDYELNRRIIEPFMSTDFTSWMGFQNQSVNNWNIWINTNVLMTSLLLLNDTELPPVLNRTLLSADKWLNWYGEDGGCDEGPIYWYQAAGRFIQFLHYMSSASGNQINWSSNPLFNRIGEYIYRMHIDKDYFVSFADGNARYIPDPTLIFRYGQMFDNPEMLGFAAYLYALAGNESFFKQDSPDWNQWIDLKQNLTLHQYILAVSAIPLLKDIKPKAPQPAESWLQDIQVITLRSEEGSGKGLFLGAKFGTNGEDHNHNDIGNFVLYVDGMPALIDLGVGVYTAKTFQTNGMVSDQQRYDIWTMQSQWHNTPTINGVQQHEGLNYTANSVKYTKHSAGGQFEADIAGAYPKEAQVNSWFRQLNFNRTAKSVNLTETYSLEKFVEPFKIHLITVLNATQDQKSGDLVLSDKNVELIVQYNTSLLEVQVDQHKTDDPRLTPMWGEHINRVSLVSKLKDTLVGSHSIVFRLK